MLLTNEGFYPNLKLRIHRTAGVSQRYRPVIIPTELIYVAEAFGLQSNLAAVPLLLLVA
jgi:hypothetical protein